MWHLVHVCAFAVFFKVEFEYFQLLFRISLELVGFSVTRLVFVDELSPSPVEQQKREQILAGLERFIRKEFNGEQTGLLSMNTSGYLTFSRNETKLVFFKSTYVAS